MHLQTRTCNLVIIEIMISRCCILFILLTKVIAQQRLRP